MTQIGKPIRRGVAPKPIPVPEFPAQPIIEPVKMPELEPETVGAPRG